MKLFNLNLIRNFITNSLNIMCPEFTYKAIYNKNSKYEYICFFFEYIYFFFFILKNHFNFNFKSIFEFTASGFQVKNSLRLIYIVNFIPFRKYSFPLIFKNEIQI